MVPSVEGFLFDVKYSVSVVLVSISPHFWEKWVFFILFL